MGAIASTIVSLVMADGSNGLLRWRERSTPRSIPIRIAPSLAGAPSAAPVPALANVTSSPRCCAIWRASASASGLLQVLPVQTKTTFTRSCHRYESRRGRSQLALRDGAGPNDARARPHTIYNCGRLGWLERSAVQYVEFPTGDGVPPVPKDCSRRIGGGRARPVGAG